jgi:C1A family cysteine protease
MIPRKLGWVPEPPDARDLPASERLGSAGPVPQSSDNGNLILSILDQGHLSSCVANATVQALRASHVKQGAINPPLASRLFAYYIARRMHGAEKTDAGTYVRSCFAAISKVGFCPEYAWPYNEDVNQMPGIGALRLAMDQRQPTEYRRIFETGSQRVDAVKRALAAGHLVVFGTQIDAAFFAVKDEVVSVPSGAVVGGHAMTITQHEGDVFKVCNSWSSDWGDRGFWSMSADYVAWFGTSDLWICEASPRFQVES